MNIFTIIETLAFILLGLGLAFLAFWCGADLKYKNNLSKLRIAAQDSKYLNSIFTAADNIIRQAAATTVTKLEQIVGKDLRVLIKSGKATKEDLYALAGDAYKEILEQVSQDVIDDLETAIDNTELYIRNIIEEQVLKLKSQLYS